MYDAQVSLISTINALSTTAHSRTLSRACGYFVVVMLLIEGSITTMDLIVSFKNLSSATLNGLKR